MKILDSSAVVCIYIEIECPEILNQWTNQNYKINICESVHKEIQKNDITYNKVKFDISNGLISILRKINNSEIEKFRNRHPNLGIGEVETILTGIELNRVGKRNYCVIDDGVARKVSKKYDVSITGTYGMIKKLHEKNILSKEQYNIILDKMKKSKFRINLDKLNEKY